MKTELTEETLIFVQIVFRHGNRTPATTFPNDQHRNNPFEPYGRGNLTQEGKSNAYILGQQLRRLYGSFLGPQYKHDEVYSMTSGLERAETTLQCVHAGLFAVENKSNQISKGLTWQPIVYDKMDRKGDKFLMVHIYDPNVLIVQRPLSLEEKEIYGYISNFAGMRLTTSNDFFNVQNALQVQKEIGLELPAWGLSNSPYSEQEWLKHTLQFWADITTHNLQKLVGPLLQLMTNNIKSKIENNKRKLILYSGHDVNVVSLLAVLNAYDKFYVRYCSFVAFELHYYENEYYLKVIFQNGLVEESRKVIKHKLLFTEFVNNTKWLYNE